MEIIYRSKIISVKVKEARGLGRIFGLMFRSSSTENLLFSFNRRVHLAVHSWFVPFSFLIIWMDEKNKVMEHRIVRPFSTAIWPSKPYAKFIEMPLQERNRKIAQFFVDKGKI